MIPSIIGFSPEGHLLVIDSKNKVRKLKRTTKQRIFYYEGNYDGPIVQQMQGSVPADKVDSFEQWKEKQIIK